MVLISDRQEMIIDAFLLLVQESRNPRKITMQMLADKVGVNRQSIYRKHFKSIDDLIDTIYQKIDEEVGRKLKDFTATNQSDLVTFCAKEILPLLYDKREWLSNLSQFVDSAERITFLEKKYRPVIQSSLSKAAKRSGLSEDLLCSLLIRQILAILTSWLTSEKPMPLSIFQEKFIHILSFSPYDLLVNS